MVAWSGIRLGRKDQTQEEVQGEAALALDAHPDVRKLATRNKPVVLDQVRLAPEDNRHGDVEEFQKANMKKEALRHMRERTEASGSTFDVSGRTT